MKNQLKIAITGGIGSGKTTVMQILSKMGYNTVSLDAVYAELLNDKNYLLELCKKFEIQPIYINSKPTLNKKALSEKVFNDKKLLKKLNDFTHKSIFDKAFEKQSNGVTFYEVPLLFEGSYQNKFDSVWVVKRAYENRIKSASQRDACSVEQIQLKAKNQIDYEKTDFSLHTVIVNDGNVAELENQVERALSEIFKK